MDSKHMSNVLSSAAIPQIGYVFFLEHVADIIFHLPRYDHPRLEGRVPRGVKNCNKPDISDIFQFYWYELIY